MSRQLMRKDWSALANGMRLPLDAGLGRAALTLFLSCFFAVMVSLRVVGHMNQLAFLWPVTGVALGIVLPKWHEGWKARAVMLASATAGLVAGEDLLGVPTRLAGMLALFTCFDVWLAAALLHPQLRCFNDLKQRGTVLRFVAAATLSPLLTGLLGALPLSDFLHHPWSRVLLQTTLANSLGIGLAAPAVLLLGSVDRWTAWKAVSQGKASLLPLFIFTGVLVFAFWQSTDPFLFLVFPPMILVLFTLGLEGALATSTLAALVSWFATVHGHGPICLMHAASPEQRLLVLQLFLWICLATALPVGALLDERRRAERSALEAESIYRVLLQNTDDAIVLSSLAGERRFASPGVEKLTGWTPEEYLAIDRLATFHPDDVELALGVIRKLKAGESEQQFRYRAMHRNGGWRWVEAAVRAYGDPAEPNLAGYVTTIRDISAVKQKERTWTEERTRLKLEQQSAVLLANSDTLTGLPNRRSFDQAMARQRDSAVSKAALLMIDVDHFKSYNDTYGHNAGDACLRQLAQTLGQRVNRAGDLAARLGGEEFAMLLPGTDEAVGLAVAEDMLKAVRALSLEHKCSPLGCVSVSIGVAAWESQSPLDPAGLLEAADRALYTAKRMGKDRAYTYSSHVETANA